MMHALVRWGLVALFGLGGIVAGAAQEPTAETTPPPVMTLRIWFPDTLGASDDGTVASLLSGWIADFQAANPDVQVDFRLKRAEESASTASVMQQLETAQTVAPGALPHLTLLRRNDLVAAVEEGLIAPLAGAQGDALLEGFADPVRALGSVSAQPYGVPFLLELQHLAAQPGVEWPASGTLTDVHADARAFAFPAHPAGGSPDLVAAQLAESGGLTEDGLLQPSPDALIALYGFYRDAQADGLLPGALDARAPADFLSLLASGELEAGAVSSTDYLRLTGQGVALQALPLPTSNGGPASVLDGWLWVLPAGNADERALALRFVDWMNAPDRLADMARAVHEIPAREDALAVWMEGEYGQLVAQLLNGALVPADWARRQPELARALHDGLVQVLTGAATPEQVAATAVP